MPPEITISKNKIRTMKKDIDFAQGKVNVEPEEDAAVLKTAALAEEKKEREEEQAERERVEKMERMQKENAERAAREAEEAKEKTAAAEALKAEEARKKAEVERLLTLQEERKRAEEERKKIEERQAAIARAKIEEERKRKEAEAKRLKTIEESRKKAEEAKIAAASKKTEKDTLLEEREKILSEKNKLKEEILSFEKNSEYLDSAKRDALAKIEEVEEEFKKIESQEVAVENEIKLIEQKESTATKETEKRSLEKKRWQAEDKRHNLEKERWPWDEKLQQAENALSEIQGKLQEEEKKRKSFGQREKETSSREEKNQLALERIRLKEEIKGVDSLKSSLEKNVDVLFEKFNQSKAGVDKIKSEEAEIRNRKKEINEAESSALSLADRRKSEQERWEIEEKIREIESRRWAAEKENKRNAEDLKLCQNKVKSFALKKEEAARRIEEITRILEGKPSIPIQQKPPVSIPSPTPPPPPPSPAPHPVAPAPVSAPKPEPPPPPSQPIDDKIEIAKKRLEAMKKNSEEEDVAQMVQRREEEKKEVQKMVVEDQKREEESNKEERREEIIRVVPQKPSWKEKFWIRLIIVVFVFMVLAGILTFWYWYFKIRNQAPIQENSNQVEQQITIAPPSPLFPVDGTTIILIPQGGNILSSLTEYLSKNNLEEGKFYQIVPEGNGKILNILTDLKPPLPKDALDALRSETLMMFVYGEEKGKIGFAVKAKGEGSKDIFTKEKDTISKAFAQLNLTFSSISDYYIVAASSKESLDKAVVKMESLLKGKLLLKDLKIGDKSDDVKMLQMWMAKDISVYPEHLTDGNFGTVTRNAVIRFQVKYANEILKPQNLSKGTGIVDLLTRKKLNSLYSDF